MKEILCDNVFIIKSVCQTFSHNHYSLNLEHILAHTGEKPYQYNLCDSFFSSRKCYKPPEDLLTLEKSLINAYKIICGHTACDKDLKFYYCLKTHLKVHTGEKPY